MSHVTQQPIWAGDRDISATGFSTTADNTRIRVKGSQLNQANQDALAAIGKPNSSGIYDFMSKKVLELMLVWISSVPVLAMMYITMHQITIYLLHKIVTHFMFKDFMMYQII